MAVREEAMCALCSSVSVVQNTIVTIQITARDVEEAIGMLRSVDFFLRGARQIRERRSGGAMLCAVYAVRTRRRRGLSAA